MSRKSIAYLGAIAAGWCALAINFAGADQRGQWYDLDEKALARFEFNGTPLPESVEALKREYPAAESDDASLTGARGLECFVVRDLKGVDSARFFFCDGRLYRFEAEYLQPRLAKLGGVQALLQRLVRTWGPADHAGESRWTWQRPMYSRRADFYSFPGRAQLILSDMALMPVAARRLDRATTVKTGDTAP